MSALLFLVTNLAASALLAAAAEPGAESQMLLREGWAIQSSADVHEDGAAISTPGFKARDWYAATLPSTVLSALVQNRIYPDPYFGMNLRSIPGTSYPIFNNFSGSLMPPDSPFRHSWWYRTEFKLPPEYRGKTLRLAFDGINFRANVWMNGRQIASSDTMSGMWRLFEFDVTATAKPGDTNSLAVEVFPPQPHDLATTLVDWGPMPPDKEMGIWRDVHIIAAGPVALRYPAVLTKLNLPSTDQAQLTVRVELKNAASRAIEGELKGKIENVEFSQRVKLGANETQVVRFTPDKFPQLRVANPRLWWPAQVGSPNLYPLELNFEVNGQVSDSSHTRFGIREVTSEVDGQGHRLFHINGKNILIRGAGYSFDMLLRSTPERQEAELKYVRDLNLNTVRLEGKLEDDHFLELCDELGILVMPGWCCCDHWERWQTWDADDEMIAAESLRDQIRRLQRHPSVFTWLNGSDNPPPAKIEKIYIQVLRECDWTNPYVSSATAKPTAVTGASGVKMTGPYEYIAPSYWLTDTNFGGAHGFNTETSPGPAIPPIESLRRMLPPDHLWPIDDWWEYHAGGMSRTLKIFTEALDVRYGKATSVEDYARKAQVLAYEGHRAMMEAFGRNKYTSTGVIQWMLNNAWPSMIWHLYDWYLRPGGSYFGVKSACEPLHVQYSYDDHSIVVVNSYYRSFPGLKVTAKVYNLDMTVKFSREATLDVDGDSSTRVFTLPAIEGLTTTYFVNLTLESSGNLVSRNFYWLSTKPEEVDFAKVNPNSAAPFQTIATSIPTKTFADFTALSTLPQVDLDVTAQSKVGESEGSTTVTLRNPSSTLAFAVRLKVKRAPTGRTTRQSEGVSDDEVLPVLWQDNYFALLPGDSRQVTATYNIRDLLPPAAGSRVQRRDQPPAAVQVEVEGWNVKAKQVQP
jgi:exo-1,4-beta-D-glucosaminidase